MSVNNDDFVQQIKDNLNVFEPKQIIFFSWLCAVRAFPFLGASTVSGIYSEKLMKYLYNILRSIDMTYAAAMSIRSVTATDAATAAIVADDAEITYGDDTRFAVKATSCSAYVAYVCSANNVNMESAVNVAIDAAVDVAVNANAAAGYHGIALSGILLEDIKKIKEYDYFSFSPAKDIYGSIWEQFQNALQERGCEFWGNLYSDIFDSGFVLNTEALERRINIPAEIQAQGVKGVGSYLEKLELYGSRCLNESRIIILGEKGAGKTCLARRLVNLDAPMTEKDEGTSGVVTTIWKIDECGKLPSVNVHIWDFAGHVITHAAHRCFLSERCLYIIVYDGRTEGRNRLRYWLEHIKNYGGGAPVRILVNMFDNHKPDIPENTLKEKYPYIEDFVYLSIAKDKDSLRIFRDETSEFIRTNPFWDCLEIPENYVRVKENLEKRFQSDSGNFYNEHISRELFDQIVESNNIERSDTEQLLKNLHELGICLWYDDFEEFNTLVLNPEWISHGIYSLINWAHNHSKHTISIEDYEVIFKDEKERYSRDKLSFIFMLMKKYELAYSRDNNDIITIPFLLREDRPENLPYFSVEDSLLIQYVAEQPLPPNTVSRLIVRHNEEIRDNNEVWRYGVVLNYMEDTVALVKEDDRKITIKVKGGHKSEYIARLRSSMNDIFNSYKGDKPDLLYKIIANETVVVSPYEMDENKGLMISDEIIKSYAANGRTDYYHPQSNRDIPLDRTMQIYNITTTNAAFGDNAQISSNTFNFYDCNLALQGELRSLISSLNSGGHTEEAKQLDEAVSELEMAENLETKKDIIKSGGLTKVKSFLEDIGDEKSTVGKVISGIKYGVQTAQSIAKSYNAIAQWIGFPQVPKPFLGE